MPPPVLAPFQSLLCWIMVCKAIGTGDVYITLHGFNPCYVGLWSVRRAAFCLLGSGYPVSILVMLDYGL